MKRIEVFTWQIHHADGRASLRNMTLEDGHRMGAELVQGSDRLIDLPETYEEIVESWMTGETFHVVPEEPLRLAA